MLRYSPLLGSLKPIFTLMGSVAEGTRLSIANEIDICMEFEGLKSSPFSINLDDPYHLYKTEYFPGCMKEYFDSKEHFVFQKFKHQLLEAIDCVAMEVLNENPSRLQAYTPNKNYDWEKCKDCSINDDFQQCKKCHVMTTQTNVGICLQLAWNHEGFRFSNKKQGKFAVYTSIHLIPVFNTEPFYTRSFLKATNKTMLDIDQTEEWHEYLKEYLSTDEILWGLGGGDEYVSEAVLKMINCKWDKNYMVKAGKNLRYERFQSEKSKKVYCVIKVLKQSLGVDTINNYLLKKILSMPEYHELTEETGDDMELLQKVLSSSHLKHHFEKHIDFDEYETKKCDGFTSIPLKAEKPYRKRAEASKQGKDAMDYGKIPRMPQMI